MQPFRVAGFPVGDTTVQHRTSGTAERGAPRGASRGDVALETVAALGAVVSSIVGLTGRFVLQLSVVAVITLGFALLFEGLALGTRLPRKRGHDLPRVEPETAEVGAEAIAGLAAVSLGIVLLASGGPRALLPIAAIVLGAGFVAGAQPMAQTAGTTAGAPRSSAAIILRGLSGAATGAHVLAGVGAVALGIVQLARPELSSLSLVAFLALGATLLVGSAAVSGRLVRPARPAQ